MVKMVNGSRYYRALKASASALSSAFTIYPCQIRVHQRWVADSLNSNFLQLGRRSGTWPATADSLPQAPG